MRLDLTRYRPASFDNPDQTGHGDPLGSAMRSKQMSRYDLSSAQRGGTVSISLPVKTGAECGLPSGEPPACSTVTA